MKQLFSILLLVLSIGTLKAQVVFRHVTAAANTSGHITTLDHPQLNANPNVLLFILPNYNLNGAEATGQNYLENAGVWYNGSRWTIFNQKTSAPMPLNMTFNVMVAPPNNPNCFTFTATQARIEANGFPNGAVIDHPATNGKTNAMLLVTQNWAGVYNDASQAVHYHKNEWRISNNGYDAYWRGETTDTRCLMPVGARFNVMVIENKAVPGFPNAQVFMHKADTANTLQNSKWITYLAPPNLKGNKDVMLFATPYWGHSDSARKDANQAGGPYNEGPLVAWYDHPDDPWPVRNTYWSLYNTNSAPMAEGAKINVVALIANNTCKKNCVMAYTTLKRSNIQSDTACLTRNKINGSANSANQLQQGAVLLYRTDKGRLGKMEILEYGYNIRLRCVTYNANGSIYRKNDNLTIRGTWNCDLDNAIEASTGKDFWWEQVSATERWLAPQSGASFWLLCPGKPYMETYRSDVTNRPTKTIITILPGQREAETITVEDINGQLIYQGDIILGPAATRRDAAIPVEDYKWAGARVPFVIANNHPRRADILDAIAIMNSQTPVRFIPRAAERDFVQFNFVADDCSSYVGRRGGGQEINIGTSGRCGNSSILHEIMHCLGFYHEQSRSDRDDFVQINWDRIISGNQHNFRKELATRSVCPYDFGSLMHYSATGFSIDGNPTIIPRTPLPAGVIMGQRNGFSSCDLQAIRNLYSSPAPDEIVDVRITIRTGADDLRCQSQAVMNMTTSAGGSYDVMLNRGAGWGGGSTNSATMRLPAGSTGITRCVLNFEGRRQCQFFWESPDNWNVDMIRVELIRADGSIRVIAEETGTPVRRFLSEGSYVVALRP